MLPEPDLFQCGSPTCGTLGRRRRELEEEERSPGERWRSAVVEERSPGDFPSMAGATVLAPEATLTLTRGLVEGQGTLGRAKPLQVYSSLLSGTSTVVGEQERAVGSGRRWYLLVIVLLYIGLITSFCLNVTLLVRREPERVLRLEEMARTGEGEGVEVTTTREREFAYTTACLVEDPCLAGSYYSCPARRCLPCPASSYQPQWGQTSCWPCPANTTTDGPGTASPAACRSTQCVHRSRPGLAVLESPNYPGLFPRLSTCHWRVEPGEGGGLLLLLPYLALPPACTHTLTIRTAEDTHVFSSCNQLTEPLLLTAEASVLWVDFSPSPPSLLPSPSTLPSNLTGGGFQLSLVSVPSDLLPLIQAATGHQQDSHLDRIQQQIWGYNQKEQRLMSHLLSLLAPGQRPGPPGQRLGGQSQRPGPPGQGPDSQGDKPLIEVVEDL